MITLRQIFGKQVVKMGGGWDWIRFVPDDGFGKSGVVFY
jgi:hypothetical protein